MAETKSKSGTRQRVTAEMMPCLIADAPSAFEMQYGGSLERMRLGWGMTRHQVSELVLLGLVRQLRELQRQAAMREPFRVRRAA